MRTSKKMRFVVLECGTVIDRHQLPPHPVPLCICSLHDQPNSFNKRSQRSDRHFHMLTYLCTICCVSCRCA